MLRECVVLVGSALVLLTATPAWSVSVDDATAEQRSAAQKMFEAGDELYEGGRYDEAARAFRASYGVISSPNSRLMLARSLRDAGQLVEAFVEYQGTIADANASGGRYDEALTSATAEVQAVRAKLAFVEVNAASASQADELRLGSRSVSLSGATEVPVEPGEVTVGLFRSGNAVLTETVALAAGDHHTVGTGRSGPAAAPKDGAKPKRAPRSEPLTPPEPAPEPNSTLRTGAYVAGGVGIAGLASFGVLGLLARGKRDSLDDACPQGTCPRSSSDDIDQGRLYQTLANVGLGIGVLGLAAGTTLFVLSSPDTPESAALRVELGPQRVDLTGRF